MNEPDTFPPPDTLGRALQLTKARRAALRWWCDQLVAVTDPGVRAALWAQMQAVLDADAATLAPWMRRRRRPNMDPATFLRLDAHYRHQRREEGHETTEDVDIAALMALPLRTYQRYKRGQW